MCCFRDSRNVVKNSTYAMMVHFFKNHDGTFDGAKESHAGYFFHDNHEGEELSTSFNDWLTLSQVVCVFKPFQDITNIL